MSRVSGFKRLTKFGRLRLRIAPYVVRAGNRRLVKLGVDRGNASIVGELPPGAKRKSCHQRGP